MSRERESAEQVSPELAALRARVECYELALRGANTGLWEWDAETGKVFYSERWKSMFGYAPDEIGDSPAEWSSRLHPDDRDPALADLRQYLKGAHGLYESRFRLRHRDGSYRTIHSCGCGVRAAHGRVVRLAGTFADITDWERAEQALRLTQFCVERASVGVFRIEEPDARIVYVNEQACRSLGYTAEELCRLTVFDIDPTFSLERWREHRRVLRARGSGTIRTTHRRKDGTTYPVEVTVTYFEYQGKGFSFSFAHDITQRERTENALRAGSQRLELALRSAQMGTWDWDIGGNVVQWSPETEHIFGLPTGEFGGTYEAYARFIAPESLAEITALVERFLAVADESREIRYDHPIVRADGTDGWVEVRGSLFLDDQGRPARMTGICGDISARRRDEQERAKLEEQLRLAQKMEAVGQLAGGVAHDFNNILTAMLGNVELAIAALADRLPDAMDLLDGLRQIEKSALRAASLTRQLLAFSRRQVMRPEVIDLNATLRDLDRMLRRLIAENVKLDLVLAPEPVAVRADPGQLEQVIVNLVVNARDAMRDGGRLTLEARSAALDETYLASHTEAQPGEHVVLAVSDTGHGMDRATLERIFEPFFTTKPVGEGTGLGLATAYGIVKQLGGHITAYSEPGKGTSFKVYLPRVFEPVCDARRVAVEQAPPSGTETVILCEDDKPVRDLTAHILGAAGYTVLVAGHPHEALVLAAEHDREIDLLITDVIMPEMNGRSLADALTARRPGIRTLFVSGYTSNIIVHHGVLEANVEFLEKPYSRRELLARVRAVLDGRSERSARSTE